AGVVGNRTVELGQILQAGQSALSVIPLDDVWVTANYKESQLRPVRVGQSVTVSVDALGGREYRGHVDTIAPATGARFSLLPAETFQVKDLVIRRDAGILTLRSGTISFIPATLGRVTKAVFLGEGEFTLKPAFWVETNYLKRLTGKDTIQETFRQLVLCFTDD